MAISFPYSSAYYPPAPTVEVSIKAQAIANVTALLDSGADGTMIPLDILKRIGATFLESSRMYGVTGYTINVDFYLVEVQIGNHQMPGIHAVGLASGTEPIIGRDVLNQLIVTLDGISGVTEIS